MKVRYTSRARHDIDEIFSYIAKQNPQAAQRVQAAILATISLVAVTALYRNQKRASARFEESLSVAISLPRALSASRSGAMGAAHSPCGAETLDRRALRRAALESAGGGLLRAVKLCYRVVNDQTA